MLTCSVHSIRDDFGLPILLNRPFRSHPFVYFKASFSCEKHQGKLYKTQRILVANLATNFWILVASTIILVALATVLSAISCPVNPLYHCPSARFSVRCNEAVFFHIASWWNRHLNTLIRGTGLVLGLKLELQLLCETMSFGFTCRCMMWGCGCPSVVVIGNWVLLYLSYCIQTGI